MTTTTTTEIQSTRLIGEYDSRAPSSSAANCRPPPSPLMMPGVNNVILNSATIRMTLVATSTAVTVTALALLAIGLSDLLTDPSALTEPIVFTVAGVVLLATATIQFLCVCRWSGWCSILHGRSGFQLINQNQILVNGQLLTVQENTSTGTSSGFSKPPAPPSSKTAGGHSETCALMLEGCSDRDKPAPVIYNVYGHLTPSPAASSVADASTSTRGDLHHLPSRIYAAPIAAQEEITPSLRSSFQSFDDI